MKKCLISLLVLSLFFVSGFAQEEEGAVLNEIVLKKLPASTASMNALEDGACVHALMVGASDVLPTFADFAILDFANDYSPGKTWNMIFVVSNSSSSSVNVGIEFELRWWEGARKVYKKWSRTIAANTVMLYYTPITPQIAQLGLFTLYGRVSGLRIGNHNEVMTQLYIY